MRVEDAVSWLFVPGDRPERFTKAVGCGADVVILDLQDAVAPDAKDSARDSVLDWLSAGGQACVRMNPVNTPEGLADLAALSQWRAVHTGTGAVAAVVAPLSEEPSEVDEIAAAMPDVAVVLLVESARGVTRLRELASHPIVSRLAFGNLDTAADLGCAPDSPTLDDVRSTFVLESRAAGLPGPIDGVTPDFADVEATATDAASSHRRGFTGKLCIHPRQVAAIHAAFAPTEAEIGWARRVEAAVRTAGGGAVALDGVMLDAPVLRRAQQILHRSAPAEEG
ncbi:MAG: HpcH/HpaI aldolase/citrate lyase family protein [Microthrixaceae bacterium]